MARSKRAVFNPLGPFVVWVAFRFNGALLTAGTPFTEKLTERRLRILYDSRRLDLTSTEVKEEPVFDWRTLEETELLAYAFEQTGSRFRKVERAVKALEDLC